MDNTENSYLSENPATDIDPAVLIFNEEKKAFRRRINTVGLMIIIATAVFLTFSTLVLITYWVFEGTATLPSSVDSIPDNIVSGLSNIAAIGLCGLIFLKVSKNKMSDMLVFDKISAKKLLAVVSIGFTVCMVSNFMTNIYLMTTESLGINLNLDIESPVSNSALEIIVYFLSTSIVPAFSEEILFRGAVLGSLRKNGDAFAVFVSSFLFGLFHGNFVQFPFAFLVGIVLSWAVIYTNSMLPAIIIHAANNGFSVICDVLYTNSESMGLNESIIDAFSVILVAAIALVSILAVIKLSKSDRNFMNLSKYEGTLDGKTRTKALVTSPTIIISAVLLLAESVMTHLQV